MFDIVGQKYISCLFSMTVTVGLKKKVFLLTKQIFWTNIVAMSATQTSSNCTALAHWILSVQVIKFQVQVPAHVGGGGWLGWAGHWRCVRYAIVYY